MPSQILMLFLLLFSFLTTLAGTRVLLPILQRRRMGQRILEIGPRWHKSKEGTPTMGGILFLLLIPLTVGLGSLLTSAPLSSALLPTLLYAIFNGCIGILDDVQKYKKQENLGLLPWQKLLLQTLLSAAYLLWLMRLDFISDTVSLPFSDLSVTLGPLYFFILLFCMVGIVNCANLTDGVDGLAAAVFTVIALLLGSVGMALDDGALYLLRAAAVGCMCGFLIFNFHPAAIFMGDTGSLFLGALAVGGAFLMRMPLLMLIYGCVYVIEGVSVVLQVFFYKLTRKRLFLMAPLHHHMEKRGLKEPQIVILFTLLALCGALLSLALLI